MGHRQVWGGAQPICKLTNRADGCILQGAPGTVNANDYDLFRERYRLGKVFTMQQRGSTCFDFDYYRAHSPDLPSALDAEVWRHFLEHGQFEGRLFRSAVPPAVTPWRCLPPVVPAHASCTARFVQG